MWEVEIAPMNLFSMPYIYLRGRGPQIPCTKTKGRDPVSWFLLLVPLADKLMASLKKARRKI